MLLLIITLVFIHKNQKQKIFNFDFFEWLEFQAGTVTSHEKKDTYSTRDPEFAFDKRIKVIQ